MCGGEHLVEKKKIKERNGFYLCLRPTITNNRILLSIAGCGVVGTFVAIQKRNLIRMINGRR